MPVIDTSTQQFIDSELIRLNTERSEAHESRGGLSASMLYQPLRFQVLKSLGAPRREIDPYVLGKFKRGTDVEDWYVEQLQNMNCLVSGQKEVFYRETRGFIDALVDTKDWQFKCGVLPLEVKSITNAKLRRVKKTGIDWHYKLQACLYALAEGSEHYAVTIISAEDLRTETYIFKTREMANDVDKRISAYIKAMEDWRKDRVLPKLEVQDASVKWSISPGYAMFDDFWIEAPDSAVINKLEKIGGENV